MTPKITYQQFLDFITEECSLSSDFIAYIKDGPALTIEQIYNNIPHASWYHRLYYAVDGGSCGSMLRGFEMSWEEANLDLLHSLDDYSKLLLLGENRESQRTGKVILTAYSDSNRVLIALTEHLDNIRIPWDEFEQELLYAITDNRNT